MTFYTLIYILGCQKKGVSANLPNRMPDLSGQHNQIDRMVSAKNGPGHDVLLVADLLPGHAFPHL